MDLTSKILTPIYCVTQVLVLVGALNWGLVGAYNIDIVSVLVPKSYDGIIKMLIGLCALIVIGIRLYATTLPFSGITL